MDAFFAAIEQLDNRALRGRPVLVGHDGPRGVVATASYEARPFGCGSAQPMAVAKRLCPHAVVVPVRSSRYREVSRAFFEILESFSPLIEPLSVDEAFLDVSGCERLLGAPQDMARALRTKIAGTLQLTASVGVAHNKFLAKLASDLRKPDGLTVIGPQDVDDLLPPLPVTRLWGIGPATAQKLEGAGVRTIADLRARPASILERLLGREAEHFLRLAHGLDDRPVVPDSQARSIGQECTFGTDVACRDHLEGVLLDHVEMVCRRLRGHGLRARTISLKIRDGSFRTLSRCATLPAATDATDELWMTARRLFETWAAADFRPLRLLGASVTGLTSQGDQMELFPDGRMQRLGRIDRTADRIVERFGHGAIRRGGTLRR